MKLTQWNPIASVAMIARQRGSLGTSGLVLELIRINMSTTRSRTANLMPARLAHLQARAIPAKEASWDLR